jgi:hypothetical protein
LRVFWHFNESDVDYVGMLPSALTLFRGVTVWAPSGSLIQEAHAIGNLSIDRSGFLDLIKSGDLQIAAREDWLVNGPSRRANRWKHAPWTADFDGVILDLYQQDLGKENPRVKLIGDETGYVLADIEVEKRSDRYFAALAMIQNGAIPKGTSERINRGRSSDNLDWQRDPSRMSIRMLLRDAYNHEVARSTLGAEVAVENDNLPVGALDRISGRPSYEVPTDTPQLSARRVKDAIQFVRSFGEAVSVDSIQKLRQDNREQNFLWEILKSERDMLRTLATQISDGLDKASLYEDLFGTKFGDNAAAIAAPTFTIAGIVSAARSFDSKSINRRQMFTGIAFAAAGGALGVAGQVERIGERNSLWSEGDYGGPCWPTLFGVGVNHPNRQQIASVYAGVLERIERGY